MSLFKRGNRKSNGNDGSLVFATFTGLAMEFAVGIESDGILKMRKEAESEGSDYSFEGDRSSNALDRICAFLNRMAGMDLSIIEPEGKYWSLASMIDACLDNISDTDSKRIIPIVLEIIETTKYLRQSAEAGVASLMSPNSTPDGKYRHSAALLGNSFNSQFGWNWTTDVKTSQEFSDDEFSWLMGLFLMRVWGHHGNAELLRYASIFAAYLACVWERSPERCT